MLVSFATHDTLKILIKCLYQLMDSTKKKRVICECPGTARNEKENQEPEEGKVDGAVCYEKDLEENEMKTFPLGSHGDVLIVKQFGQIYAVGSKCTHYGAPLEKGALGNGKVRCPWHGACFNLLTGDIEDFPGLDSLPCFSVAVQPDGEVKLTGSRKELKEGRRQKSMAAVNVNDKRVFIIAGGGPAGEVCAETLRQEGFTGTLIMLCKENVLPYDRTKLSKALDSTEDKIILRSPEFYEKSAIDVKLGVALQKLDEKKKVAHLSDGSNIKFDSIFLATGCSARELPVPGRDFENVFLLRNTEDAKKINSALQQDTELVIIGTSFIGMECATYCVGKVKKVTVLGLESVPFERAFGTQIGGQIKKWFESERVNLVVNATVKEIVLSGGDVGKAGGVKLDNGQFIPAQVVIVGAGIVPNTSYLEGSTIKMGQSDTIEVNEFLETNVPGVFAGGDVAFAPVLGTNASIGHWQLSQYHGRIAAQNMLGKKQKLNSVPFFWTMLFKKGIRYIGFAPDYDDIVIHGNLEELKFIAYFCKKKSVLAIATCGNDPVASHFANRLADGDRLSKDEISENPSLWIKKGLP